MWLYIYDKHLHPENTVQLKTFFIISLYCWHLSECFPVSFIVLTCFLSCYSKNDTDIFILIKFKI